MLRVGLISDTHNLLRDEALEFLKGCDHIIHGGDIGREEILQRLSALAPLTVVRGNNDRDPWAQSLPETEFIRLEQVGIYVIHDIKELDVDPDPFGAKVVVYGHSHKPSVTEKDGVLYVNPGAAGPRRFRLPIAVGELEIKGDSVSARVVEL